MAQSHSYTHTNQAYSAALSGALAHLGQLLANPHSRSWKPLVPPTPSSSSVAAASLSARRTSTASTATSPWDISSSSPSATPPAAAAKGKARSRALDGASSSATASDDPQLDLVNGLAALDPTQVRIHRKADKERGADIIRAVAEVACDPDQLDLDALRAILATPEIRSHWDKLVDSASTISLLDPLTRILKTDYRLGWPASPRDTITISRTFPSHDGSPSLIDLATSLPRAADEPAFLRPAPPFVRANVNLMAWCFQVVPAAPPPVGAGTYSPSLSASALSSSSPSTSPAGPSAFPAHLQPSSSSSPSTAQHHSSTPRLRITLFWQWNLRLSNPLGPTPAPHLAHIPSLLASLVAHCRSSPSTSSSSSSAAAAATVGALPLLSGWGKGVEINRDEYDVGAEMRTVEYAVVADSNASASTSSVGASAGRDEAQPANGEVEDEVLDEDDDDDVSAVGGNLQGLDELARRRERRRLARSVEMTLPPLGVLFPPAPTRADSATAAGEQALDPGGPGDGWDVRVSLTMLGGGTAAAAADAASSSSAPAAPSYTLSLSAPSPSSSLPSSTSASSPALDASRVPAGRLTLRLSHARLASPSALVRVSLSVQRLAGARGAVRVNGERVDVRHVEVRDVRAGAGMAAGGAAAPAPWDMPGGGLAPRDDDRASVLTGTSVGEGDESGISAAAGLSAPDEAHSLVGGGGGSSAPSPASIQIAALLRRSYIYFLSLLQEPPAKWRHVSDAQGVTVTQLLSPDPTLTIYRAEAVFVGVGVWDVFAAVVTPGVRRTWDRSVEECSLVAEEGTGGQGVGELSEVWWEKRKGQWPVAPRDSVLLRTAYKSPTTVHIFSSSTDDTSLFPSIPPPAPGTIRAQVDLYGWSIEALSPTTTQITLLDQSDPKGWSTKSSWTPQALVQAVAGVRDYAIKRGAPPVVTRLGGAGVRKTAEEYDPDRAALRVEYALSGTSSSSSSPASSSSSSTAQASEDASQTVECEIRCDATVWAGASGLDVVVDPPPSSVTALSRHRLSSAGGGLWLSIEHPPALVRSEGRVAVSVRRGAGPAGSVMVNGARVKTDVEVLDDDKVRLLEKQKRVKPRPVPLDQYETLGPRSTTGAAAQALAAGGAAGAAGAGQGGAALGGSSARDGLGAASSGGAKDGKDGAAGAGKAASVDGDALGDAASAGRRGSADAAAATSSTAGSTNDVAAVDFAAAPKAPLDPPACALDALAWLQTFHAEQGPELTDPAPGWAIVSERGGTVVRKKVLPRLSDTFPVYRGDKIVQGLTADEIAAVVTSPGCRKAWDERVESATPLASYGHGVTTCAIATKPAFPFKGRIFFVATANAAVKVPSASSGASTSTVLFVASASYTPTPSSGTASDSFDPVKVNPSSLPAGQVLLEGWILETLDPYTSSVLAIPSTRCTYVACVDQKGAVPLALNGVLNANLAKSISAVEQLGKTRGPLPRVWAPSAGLQIEGPLSDDSDTVDFVWRLSPSSVDAGGPSGTSQVVAADFEAADGTFRSLYRVGGKQQLDPAPAEQEVPLPRPAAALRKASTFGGGAVKSKAPPLLSPSLPVGSSLLKSELPRSASLGLGSVAPPVLQKPATGMELSHKTSRSSLRSKSPPAAPSTSSATAGLSASPAQKNGLSAAAVDVLDPSAFDLVVAELVVDLKQFPHGYSVTASSQLVAPTADNPLSLDALPPRSLAPPSSFSPASTTPTQVPLRCVAHDAPLPSILTASLDAWKRANHLVRILIPTGAITHPIQDPLRSAEDKSRASAPPDWYRLLSDEGALVEVKIVALPAPSAASERERALKAKQRGASAQDPSGDGVPAASSGAAKVTGQAAKSVVFNGDKVVVLSQKESKAVLARFEDDELPLQGAKISRVAPPKRRKASVAPDVEPNRPAPELLPVEFRQPLAVAVRLLLPKPTTPVVDDFEFPDPKSPGSTTPAVEEARSPVLGGKATLSSVASRRDTTSSDSAPATGALSGLLGTYQRLGSTIMATTVDVTETSPTGAVAVRRTFTLSFVLLVAIISFLIGSLLRSLLTPADYIIYRPESASQHAAVEHALLQAVDPHRRWRTAKRLFELRTGWSGSSWDVIVAAVRREE
ncbi:hypothetical protein JCM3775_005461 [Rhodotorula graminis]